MLNILKEKLFTKNNKLNHQQLKKLTKNEINFILKKTFFLNEYLIINKDKLKIKNSFQIRIYCLFNNITNIPTCEFKDCNNEVLFFRDYKNGFKKTCSYSCASKLNNTNKTINIDKFNFLNIKEIYNYINKNILNKKKIKFIQKNTNDTIFKESLIHLFKKIYNKKLNTNEMLYILIKNHIDNKNDLISAINKYTCYCGNKTTFYDFNRGFANYCSTKCSSSDIKTKTKIKKTCLKKYNTNNPAKNELIKEKTKSTNIKKYGVKNPSQNQKIKDKRINTNLLKYNAKHYMQTKIGLQKQKSSFIKKYGVNNPQKINSIKEKRLKTMKKKYNVSFPLQSTQIKNKMKLNNIKKWNTPYIFQSDIIKDKIKKTHLKNLGVTNPFQSDIIKDKIKKIHLKNLGVTNPFQSDVIQNKIKKNIEREYGVKNISQKHISNYKNYNKEYIINNFLNNNTIDIYAIMNYFNITQSNVYKLLTRLNIEYNNTVNYTNLEEQHIYNSFNFHKKEKIFNNTKQIISPYEIDLYIENKQHKKIGIEYNGLMFHSFGKSKYSMFNNYEDERKIIPEEKYKDLYNLNHKTYKNNEKHLLKTELCENKNIKLFHINENEWLDTQKQLIWKSIINNELGNNIIKIGARNTYIKELNTKNRKEAKLKKEFLDNNHIQGNIASNTNIGLFTKKIEHNFNKYKWYPISNHIVNKNINQTNNKKNSTNNFFNNNDLNNNQLYIIPKDTLVSLMTFGKPRFNKEYNWELLRFCNKINSSIVGAGTKLLKYFKNNYMKDKDKLISYGNRRWTNSHNNFYINNGFTFLRKSEPSFYYFHESNINKLYHRTHFQKYKLENYFNEKKYNIKNYDKILPAQIIMYNNGYRKIWDSGNLVFEMNKG